MKTVTIYECANGHRLTETHADALHKCLVCKAPTEPETYNSTPDLLELIAETVNQHRDRGEHARGFALADLAATIRKETQA